MPVFPSEEWWSEYVEKINLSEAYKKSAEAWEGDISFVFEAEPDKNVPEDVWAWLDLWHGECRDAYVVADPSSHKAPEFEVKGKIPSWKKVIDKKVDPIQALITRQLLLKGNMAKVLKSVKAAQELVNCATTVPTEFPE